MKHRIRLAIVALSLASASAFAQSDWVQQLQSGCNAGKGQDCANLGDELGMRQGDLVGARAAYEKGCKLDSLGACIGLYKALALGEGGPADPARAKALEPKACKTGIVSFDVYLKSKGLCRG